MVGVGRHRYIIPLFAVREMLRPAEEMISTVEGRAEMALVRDRLLPLVRLHAASASSRVSRTPGKACCWWSKWVAGRSASWSMS